MADDSLWELVKAAEGARHEGSLVGDYLETISQLMEAAEVAARSDRLAPLPEMLRTIAREGERLLETPLADGIDPSGFEAAVAALRAVLERRRRSN